MCTQQREAGFCLVIEFEFPARLGMTFGTLAAIATLVRIVTGVTTCTGRGGLGQCHVLEVAIAALQVRMRAVQCKTGFDSMIE